MPQTFNVVGHPQQDEIIRAIVGGGSVRDIAGRFSTEEVSLSRMSVQRFRTFYLAENEEVLAIETRESAKKALSDADMLLTAATEEAMADDNTAAKVGVARELREQAISRGKIGGWLSDNVNITDGNDARLQTLLKYAVAELAPIPGAVEALERAISKLEGDAAKDITPDSDVIEAKALEAGE